jgi:UDP-3-O-[3-hydroxymyristoyl] glucosamine N-acyltransferase
MGKVKDGSVIMGYPAIEAKEYLQIHALMNVLRKKSKQLRSLLRKDK